MSIQNFAEGIAGHVSLFGNSIIAFSKMFYDTWGGPSNAMYCNFE